MHKSASQEIVVQDMNSSYGTFINGQRIPPMIEFPINDNDIISIIFKILSAITVKIIEAVTTRWLQ